MTVSGKRNSEGQIGEELKKKFKFPTFRIAYFGDPVILLLGAGMAQPV